MFTVEKSGNAVKIKREKKPIIIMPPEKNTFNALVYISPEYILFIYLHLYVIKM